MGYFDKFFHREERTLRIEDFMPMISSTISAISVDGSSALKSPTTLACVRAISETAGGLPLHVFRRQADGSRDRDSSHRASALLSHHANPWTSSADLRVRLVHDALIYGRGIAIATRVNGVIRELHRVDPRSVRVDIDNIEPVYRVSQKSGGEISYHYSDVVDVLTPGSTIDKPLIITREAAEAISLDIAMSRYQSNLMSRGGRPASILTSESEKPMSPVQLDNVLKLIQAQSSGDNSGKTIVIPDRFKFSQQTFSSVDMQFVELMSQAKSEIMRAFRVPPTLVGDYSRAVWRNLEESAQNWLSFGLLPWLEALEFAFSRVLIDESEAGEVFLEHQVADLVRPNLAALYSSLKTATGTSFLTPNEARRAINLPPVEGGDALILQAGQSSSIE
ncbi:phage portal protein [Methylobrevis albus]|uniref:Phage portal protein n=1 Tax=Methylobrevis albus TaxID=2793297 RepID=A0A931I4K1_9HYPH|nr:phage portal protein [Methylobrevis albus]MBH0239131.1 phage portal protein [Methylobrevis albus]